MEKLTAEQVEEIRNILQYETEQASIEACRYNPSLNVVCLELQTGKRVEPYKFYSVVSTREANILRICKGVNEEEACILVGSEKANLALSWIMRLHQFGVRAMRLTEEVVLWKIRV